MTPNILECSHRFSYFRTTIYKQTKAIYDMRLIMRILIDIFTYKNNFMLLQHGLTLLNRKYNLHLTGPIQTVKCWQGIWGFLEIGE